VALDSSLGLEASLIPTVATKLLIPSTPPHLIERERLLDMLDSGVKERLVLLSAPAGVGKTALLASWVCARELPGPPCWLSLDADDNDASRLVADLLSALRSSGVIKRGSDLDQLTPPAGARTDYFLPMLVNGLTELRSPVVIMLDDIHELTSSQATAAINFLVRHAPEQCRLVLAGRADPPLPIERLRMSEEITELRIRDLAFDRSETAELCRRLDLTLADRDVDLLWERTEGWAAALRLAAVSLHGHPQPDRFLADFAGTDRAVADYLVTEVLARLPEDRREFMLRTCLVDTINPALADSLTGLEGRSTPTLAALEHSGVPVQVIVDADGHHHDSYRYHPLLRELLLVHLRHAHPEEVPFLHRRAARWYSEHGQTMAAIRHALIGEDWEHAGSLIAGNWLDLFLCGRSAAMRGPMAQLPADVVATDPRLAAAYAGSRLQDGDVQGAERQIALARSARGEIPEQMREQLELTLATVALYSARLRVHAGDAERHARKLTRLARASSDHRWVSLRSFALSNLGAVRLWAGDPVAAAPLLHDALALATEGGHEQIALDCLGQLALIHLLRGELTRAEELSSAATRLAVQRGWCDGPSVAASYLAAGAGAYQRGEFERAEGLLSQAATAADAAEAPLGVAVGLLQALSLAAAGSGSASRGALKLLAIRAAMDQDDDIPELLDVALEVAAVRVLMAAGELEQARATLVAAHERAPERPELLVRRASIELSENEPGMAAVSLGRVLDPPEGGGERVHPATLMEAWLLRALAEQSRGEQQAAAVSLDRALALAEQEPFRDAFLVNGSAVRELLECQAKTGTAHPALLEMLLDGVGQRQQDGVMLSESLTQRELRILRYLPTMLSNAEIGAEIFVSLNTVKTHLRSIYRKLDAGGRADAVDRARQLGLLPSGIKRPRVVRRA
jgi:LuxR family transcriptional regulator, maltose regulon positive regulatory protein